MKVSTRDFLASPHAAVAALVFVNIVQFLLCARASGSFRPSNEILVGNGALIPSTLGQHAYWRLIAYGILHANPTHLLMNMFSLLLIGPFLERRVGATYFLLIYLVALIAAGLASIGLHHGPFISVGASGAGFGVLGALFALWVLGKTELSPAFFLMNFTLNFAFSVRSPNIDWAAHFGGFVAGLIMVALLDTGEKLNGLWLRCKFPEFAKLNILALALSGGWIAQHHVQLLLNYDPLVITAGWVVAALILIKIFDILLSTQRGLAATVLLFVGADGFLAFIFGHGALPRLHDLCAQTWPAAPLDAEKFRSGFCATIDATPVAIGVAVGSLSLMLLAPQFVRGLKDSGFVAPTFLAERRRRSGI